MSTPSQQPRRRFLAELVRERGVLCARDPYRAHEPTPLDEHTPRDASLDEGSVCLVQRSGDLRSARVEGAPLAAPRTARAAMYRVAWEHGLDPVFSDEIEAEVARLRAAPGLDDPTLVDRTALPFVTVDGPTARDLDQALYVEAHGARQGFTVYYALADASYYAPVGSALFAEALRRGASYYLPGLSIPMLPRALSEGLVSLNPDGPRRALLVGTELDAQGQVQRSWLERALVRSRAKLSFEQVQALLDEPARSPLAAQPFAPSLRALREVGRLRMRDALARGLVRYQREELEVKLAGGPDGGARFEVLAGERYESELWNEQLSLLCNREGARLLRESDAPHVQPIYRVHPSPAPARLEHFARHLDALARTHRLDRARWRWSPEGELPLSEFLHGLPTQGAQGRVARAVQRQAIMVNMRSGYAKEAGPHHGVGANEYARFSAPMRELVGLFVHKEALELLTGRAAQSDAADEALRERVIDAANRARQTQKRVGSLAHRVVLDAVFERDAALPWRERPLRVGTVLGLAEGKVHVQFDAPPLDLKLYTRDLERGFGERCYLDEAGVALRSRRDRRALLREGDALTLRLSHYDRGAERWVLAPV